jgi:hypothetical protein
MLGSRTNDGSSTLGGQAARRALSGSPGARAYSD